MSQNHRPHRSKFWCCLTILLILTCSWQSAGATPGQPEDFSAPNLTLGGPMGVGMAKLTASNPSSDYLGFGVALSQDGSTVLLGTYGSDNADYDDPGGVYVFTRSHTTWLQQAYLSASDHQDGDRFGISVSISDDGNTALVGADRADANGHTDQGAAYVFTRSGSTWTQQAKITVAAGVDNARLGWSVALSGNGATALLGAYKANVNGFVDQGAGYVYVRSGSNWNYQATLAINTASLNLGYSTALSDNGSVALLGAPGYDAGSGTYQGAAYLYSRSGSTWSYVDQLLASDGASDDWFGRSVALDGDGDWALVGASMAVVGSNDEQGAAYLFLFNNVEWTLSNKFSAAEGEAYDHFGVSVSLSDDANTVMIGAYQANLSSQANSGAVYLRRKVGVTWQTPSYLCPEPSVGAQFGVSVALSDDGVIALGGANLRNEFGNTDMGAGSIYQFMTSYWSYMKTLYGSNHTNDGLGNTVDTTDSGEMLVVGASHVSVEGNYQQGAVYLFAIPGGGFWEQAGQLLASDGDENDMFGYSVAVSGDGSTILVGATGAAVSGNEGQGAAYVFVRSGDDWVQQKKLAYTGSVADKFGGAVALSDDGNIALVGIPMANVGAVSNQGQAVVFTRMGTTWDAGVSFTTLSGEADAHFGTAVALGGDGTYGLVGSSESVSGHANQGAAYVLKLVGGNWVLGDRLTASDGQSNDYFGSSVSLDGDGSTALIGAYTKDVNGSIDQGAAYIFTRWGLWSQKQTLTEGEAHGQFGMYVDINYNGDRLVIGALGIDIQGNTEQGKAFYYAKNPADWALGAIFTAYDGAAEDYFGSGVAINLSGDVVVIGAKGCDWGGMTDNGAAYSLHGNFKNGRIFMPLLKR